MKVIQYNLITSTNQEPQALQINVKTTFKFIGNKFNINGSYKMSFIRVFLKLLLPFSLSSTVRSGARNTVLNSSVSRSF